MAILYYVTISDCDNDYCTGCEPGCTDESVPAFGPVEPPFYGPLTRAQWFSEQVNEQLRRIYMNLERQLYASPSTPKEGYAIAGILGFTGSTPHEQ